MDKLPFSLNRKEENLFLWEVLKKMVDEAGGSVTIDLKTMAQGEIHIEAHQDYTVTISTQVTN